MYADLGGGRPLHANLMFSPSTRSSHSNSTSRMLMVMFCPSPYRYMGVLSSFHPMWIYRVLVGCVQRIATQLILARWIPNAQSLCGLLFSFVLSADVRTVDFTRPVVVGGCFSFVLFVRSISVGSRW